MSDFDAEALRWKASDDPVLALFDALYRVSAGQRYGAKQRARCAAFFWKWGTKEQARTIVGEAAEEDRYWAPLYEAMDGNSARLGWRETRYRPESIFPGRSGSFYVPADEIEVRGGIRAGQLIGVGADGELRAADLSAPLVGVLAGPPDASGRVLVQLTGPGWVRARSEDD